MTFDYTDIISLAYRLVSLLFYGFEFPGSCSSSILCSFSNFLKRVLSSFSFLISSLSSDSSCFLRFLLFLALLRFFSSLNKKIM